MATVYKVELVSHWINYTKEELKKILERAIEKELIESGQSNEITIEVQERN